MFVYVVLDKEVANLALSRRKITEVERSMVADAETTARLERARHRVLGDEMENDKVYGGKEAFLENDELPPFMRNDVAMKLLGITDPDA